jgi:hypothetical protein
MSGDGDLPILSKYPSTIDLETVPADLELIKEPESENNGTTP